MSINRGGPAALLSCLVLSIAACGGGGGGGGGGGLPPAALGLGGLTSPPAAGGSTSPGSDPAAAGDPAIAVTFEGSLDGTFILSSNYPGPVPVLIKAKLDREPTGAVYPVIVDSQHILNTQFGAMTVTRGADGSYSGLLTPNVQATPGVYSGKLQLRLCKDAACAAEYQVTGGDLPYSIEFLADVTLTAKVNGVGVSGLGGATSASSGHTLQFVAVAGSAVEVNSNIPVTWTVVSAGTDRALAVSVQTDKQVSGTITPGVLGGSVDVKATPVDPRYKYYSTVMVLGQ